jgi:NAD(P)-dependent dehydrogenase (short-subunit alcohol dehydrogenase family)
LKLAIVTGGSRGLGAALCQLYLEREWKVIDFSRSAPYPFSIGADLARPGEAAVVIGEALGRVAASPLREVVAFNNAAVVEPVGPVERSSPEAIAAHVSVNVVAAVLFARAFVATFQSHDCSKTFVNVSSGAATRGIPGWSLYCATKAALENFIRALALEQALRPQPIRAISVNPGVMDTDMQATVRSASKEDFPPVERFIRYKHEGTLAPPEQVAARIAEIVASRPEAGGVYSV